MKKPENIILIIVDCLRADCAYDRKLMPFANKTFRYKKEAYTNAPSTHFAMPAILTGKVPFEVTDREGINENNIDFYLPKIMKEKGYNTVFITGNVITSRYFGYNQYWDYFEDFLKSERIARRKIIDRIRRLVPSFAWKNNFFVTRFIRKGIKRFTNQPNIEVAMKVHSDEILEKLKSVPLKSKNNFICLHLMEPHAPYCSRRISDKKIKEKIKKLTKKLYLNENSLNDKEAKFLKEMYVEEVKDADGYIEQMYNFFKYKLGIEKSLIIVTADHGEAFNETGYFKHRSEKLSNVHHIKIPFFSNRHIKRKIMWSNNIYELIASSAKNLKFNDRNFCTGYRKTEQGNYAPAAFFDLRTKEIITIDNGQGIDKVPREISKIVLNSKKTLNEAIQNIKIPEWEIKKSKSGKKCQKI